MANILDYLAWRGDLALASVPLCELDALVFSRLAYLPMEGLAPAGFEKAEPLYDVLNACRTRAGQQDGEHAYRLKEDDDLITALLNSPRYADARLTGLCSRFDPALEQQFCAVTLLLPDDTAYIAYRGTDGTVVGWKEDFNMCFSDAVPAQTEALSYLNRAAAALPHPLRLGGHSKGGNIAVYAYAFCDANMRSRILTVYNHDGPGFNASVLERMKLGEDANRIRTFVPQGSIIGMLQGRAYPYTIIHSASMGILQHDLYKWQIERDRLLREDDLTMTSLFMDSTFKEWLGAMPAKEREDFVDAFFSLFLESGATTFGDLIKGSGTRSILHSYQMMDDATKHTVKQGLSILATSMKKTAPDTIERVLGKWSALAGGGMHTFVSAIESALSIENEPDEEASLPAGGNGAGLPG